MPTTKTTYDVYRTENRAEGRTDHVGQVEGETAEQALEIAEGLYECRSTSHLWVRDHQPEDDA